MLSVGLRIEKLDELLTQISKKFLEDGELIEEIQGLLSRLEARRNDRELSRDEFQGIVDVLDLILSSGREVPPNLVSAVHSKIGLAQHKIGQNKSAIASFTKALWIETSSRSPNLGMVGLTIHRIGICHRHNMNYPAALFMLKKALATYQMAGFALNHPYVLHAEQEISASPKIYHGEL